MSDRFSDSEASREALSALADGEAPSAEVARACAAWKEVPEARSAWHAYQLIGDVMRSEDLAQASPADAFLKNFRERLAQEPVVLVPAAAAAQKIAAAQAAAARMGSESSSHAAQPVALKRRAWLGPVGVAAGFVAVVGALMSSQMVPTGPSGPSGDVSIAQAQSGAAIPDLSLSVAPVQQGVNAFVPMSEPVRTSGVVTGPSFNRPENVYVIVVRDPRIEHVMSAASQVGANNSNDVSFAGQGAQARLVVFDAR
jgi:sigma-E factor negative regulatory protein RseA